MITLQLQIFTRLLTPYLEKIPKYDIDVTRDHHVVHALTHATTAKILQPQMKNEYPYRSTSFISSDILQNFYHD